MRISTALAGLAAFSLALAGCESDTLTPNTPSPTPALSVSPGGPATATVSGVSGDATTDPGATYPSYILRYTGNPAPTGYSHDYQWADPAIVTPSPEDGPVTLEGTIDIDEEVAGMVAMIGLLDRADLEAGNTSFQRGAYIYVYRQTATSWRIGITDGNSGGEIVQAFITVPDTDLPADGVLDVVFTVDGTADGSTCATGPFSTPAGCLTLEVSGGSVDATLTDSYGDIVGLGSATPEFATGAVLGWDDYVGSMVPYTLTVPILSPETADDCKKGGWMDYGFKNQGQCVRFVETGKDSR